MCMCVPYNDDGLARVCLGGVLVGSSRDDLGQADGYRRVSEPDNQNACVWWSYVGG
jgi:hypothetical protein